MATRRDADVDALGTGPVFIHESIAATRRWQLYALRSFFVLGLLAAMAMAWYMLGTLPANHPARPRSSDWPSWSVLLLRHRDDPDRAGAAGRPGRDRRRDLPGPRRGNLTHMLVTDLSSTEIVLGKLAARLVPVFALMAATVPVLALAGLLGGVIIDAILALTLITVVLAVFGCALAMAVSVRATRTHGS